LVGVGTKKDNYFKFIALNHVLKMAAFSLRLHPKSGVVARVAGIPGAGAEVKLQLTARDAAGLCPDGHMVPSVHGRRTGESSTHEKRLLNELLSAFRRQD